MGFSEWARISRNFACHLHVPRTYYAQKQSDFSGTYAKKTLNILLSLWRPQRRGHSRSLASRPGLCEQVCPGLLHQEDACGQQKPPVITRSFNRRKVCHVSD